MADEIDNVVQLHKNCGVEPFIAKLTGAIGRSLRGLTQDAEEAAYDAFVDEVRALTDEACDVVCSACFAALADRLDFVRRDLEQQVRAGFQLRIARLEEQLKKEA